MRFQICGRDRGRVFLGCCVLKFTRKFIISISGMKICPAGCAFLPLVFCIGGHLENGYQEYT